MNLTHDHHEILRCARSMQGPFTSQDIRRKLGPVLPRQTVWSRLHQLQSANLIDVVGRDGRLNVYRLSPRLQPGLKHAQSRPTLNSNAEVRAFLSAAKIPVQNDLEPAVLTNTHARALIDKIVDLLAELEQELPE